MTFGLNFGVGGGLRSLSALLVVVIIIIIIVRQFSRASARQRYLDAGLLQSRQSVDVESRRS